MDSISVFFKTNNKTLDSKKTCISSIEKQLKQHFTESMVKDTIKKVKVGETVQLTLRNGIIAVLAPFDAR